MGIIKRKEAVSDFIQAYVSKLIWQMFLDLQHTRRKKIVLANRIVDIESTTFIAVLTNL